VLKQVTNLPAELVRFGGAVRDAQVVLLTMDFNIAPLPGYSSFVILGLVWVDTRSERRARPVTVGDGTAGRGS